MGSEQRFRMGRLDHVHIRVPDRAKAANWYAEHLGFEPVAASDFWAKGIEGGPLHISADGGETGLALFGVSEGHPMVLQQTGVAFSVDADTFLAFARSLPSDIDNPLGERLSIADLVDFDMCWAFDLCPWPDFSPRFWPREVPTPRSGCSVLGQRRSTSVLTRFLHPE